MGSASASATGSTLFAVLHDPTDPEAWRRFVKRYGPFVYAWCRRRGLPPADAEEVTADVLGKLAIAMRTFVYDPTKGFRRWLRTVARHALVDFLEQRRRCVGSESANVAAMLDRLEAPEDFERSLGEAYDLEVLDRAMARVRVRVSRETLRAFTALAVEGRPGREVATTLGMSLSAAYEARNRVQTMLREEIQRLEREPQGGSA